MQKAYKVSIHWLKEFLMYLEAESCYIPPFVRGLNLANPESVAVMVKDYMLPEFLEENISRQFYIKSSMKYGLNFWSEENFEHLLDDMDLVVYIPQTIKVKKLFEQIWELMFVGEDFRQINKAMFIESKTIIKNAQ